MNVVITGATKGIGRAIAEKFAAEGHSVIACARTEADLQQMAADFLLQFPGVEVKIFTADIGDALQVKKFAKWIIESGIVADILVNNAGYFIAGSVYNEQEESLHKMMEVNLYSAYDLSRALLPAMMEQKKGHIFNICSVASFTPYAYIGSYGVTKFALYGLTKILREEMKPFGIKVTAVSPGATLSASWEGADISAERLLDARDIAKMVFAATQLSPCAVVEDITIRPLLGDF